MAEILQLRRRSARKKALRWLVRQPGTQTKRRQRAKVPKLEFAWAIKDILPAALHGSWLGGNVGTQGIYCTWAFKCWGAGELATRGRPLELLLKHYSSSHVLSFLSPNLFVCLYKHFMVIGLYKVSRNVNIKDFCMQRFYTGCASDANPQRDRIAGERTMLLDVPTGFSDIPFWFAAACLNSLPLVPFSSMLIIPLPFLILHLSTLYLPLLFI